MLAVGPAPGLCVSWGVDGARPLGRPRGEQPREGEPHRDRGQSTPEPGNSNQPRNRVGGTARESVTEIAARTSPGLGRPGLHLPTR